MAGVFCLPSGIDWLIDWLVRLNCDLADGLCLLADQQALVTATTRPTSEAFRLATTGLPYGPRSFFYRSHLGLSISTFDETPVMQTGVSSENVYRAVAIRLVAVACGRALAAATDKPPANVPATFGAVKRTDTLQDLPTARLAGQLFDRIE